MSVHYQLKNIPLTAYKYNFKPFPKHSSMETLGELILSRGNMIFSGILRGCLFITTLALIPNIMVIISLHLPNNLMRKQIYFHYNKSKI